MSVVDFSGRVFRLSTDERVDLARQLAATVDRGTSRYSVHLLHAHDDAALLSLQNTGDIFGREFGNDPEMLELEYSEAIPHMTHIVVMDDLDSVVASTSYIHRAAGLNKTIVDASREPWNVPMDESLKAIGLTAESLDSWDIATMAVTEKHRSGRLSLAMLRAGAFVAQSLGVSVWTAILDSASARGFRQALGPFTHEIPGASGKPYLGSASSFPLYWKIPAPAEVAAALPWMRSDYKIANFVLDNELQTLRESYDVIATGLVDLTKLEREARDRSVLPELSLGRTLL